jgi:hypothetical protein
VGAVESEYNATWCGTAKNTVLESGPDMMLFSQESWGIMTPTSKANDPFQDATTHCVGYVRILYGKTTAMGSCRWTDNTGDTFVGEFEDVPGKPDMWTFLAGKGKWKGIHGGGTGRVVGAGKPAQSDTSQVCTEVSGKYKLP